MNDIERARINRWFNRFWIDISVGWPRSAIGYVWFALLCVMPIGLMILSIKLTKRAERKIASGEGGDAA